jgi:hypothetical protein
MSSSVRTPRHGHLTLRHAMNPSWGLCRERPVREGLRARHPYLGLQGWIHVERLACAMCAAKLFSYEWKKCTKTDASTHGQTQCSVCGRLFFKILSGTWVAKDL